MPEENQPPTVEIIIPVYNEADCLEAFHHQLVQAISTLPYVFLIHYVNDGSSDDTGVQLKAIQSSDQRVAVTELSRNFGHQAALTAGLDQADADYVITMDGDGQHPPELISTMLRMAGAGAEVVLTQRMEDPGLSSFKRWTSSTFYKLINTLGDTQIIPGSADFRLMTRPVVQAFCEMREYHRFLRGMVSWMGYKTAVLPYQPPDRLGGESKYTLRKMLKLAMNAAFSFSLVPLYIGISLGCLLLLGAVLEVIYVLSLWITGHQSSLAPGWSSLMFMLMFVSGILMVLLGFIGIYIGYIFQEVKGRPIYLARLKKDRGKAANLNRVEE